MSKKNIEPKPTLDKQPPEYLIARNPDYRKIYATNVMVDAWEEDIRIDFFNEKVRLEHGLHYLAESAAILTPQAAKVLSGALEVAIAEYEKAHGPIKTQKSPVADNTKKDRNQRTLSSS